MMMIVMKPTATAEDITAVVERVNGAGARAHVSPGDEITLIGAIGNREHIARLNLEGFHGVASVVPILKPYKLASSELRHGNPSVLEIAGRRVGGPDFALIAGPCTVESREQTLTTAHAVNDAGATMFRGGAYKPRSSPYAFRGLGRHGLRLLAEAKAQTGLPIVTEVLDARDIELVAEVADVVQIGARNMQNYTLLSEVGLSGIPVLLKRGLAATLEELLMSAEYILKEGNSAVMLCERGIRTFETGYRFTLDLTAVPVLKELTHLPVIVDPSHAAGRRALVTPLSLAAAAAGADGIIVETHPAPDDAVCDGPQALPTDALGEYAAQVRRAAAVAGKRSQVLDSTPTPETSREPVHRLRRGLLERGSDGNRLLAR
jgi:3-deoxy-7-phosphoheptulonate synthase